MRVVHSTEGRSVGWNKRSGSTKPVAPRRRPDLRALPGILGGAPLGGGVCGPGRRFMRRRFERASMLLKQRSSATLPAGCGASSLHFGLHCRNRAGWIISNRTGCAMQARRNVRRAARPPRFAN